VTSRSAPQQVVQISPVLRAEATGTPGFAERASHSPSIEAGRAPTQRPALEIMRGEIGDHGTIQFPKMEPVPRPEWAFPIEVGVHARSFYSALPEQPTRDVLQALRDAPKLLSFLERRELGRLEFSDSLPKPNWYGSYDPPMRNLVVNAFRPPCELWKRI